MAVDWKMPGVDRIARAELQDLRIAAHHPKRRMRALEWPHCRPARLVVKFVAMEGEWLRHAESCAQIIDEFGPHQSSRYTLLSRPGRVSSHASALRYAFVSRLETND